MKVLVSVLIAAVCLLLAPTAALAENYVVNDIGDEADVAVGSGGCDADAGAPVKCTLRAAIQESNASASTDDTITFAALFNGEAADTISAGAGFPAITDKVTIDGDAGGAGGQCTTEAAGVKGPCVGIARTVAGSVLVVENTDGVTVEGLALTNATGPGAAAINVLTSSASFVARDNWLGVKLDGSAGANEKGIFLDPDSNGATIGGTAAADRNVFANNAFEGLDVEGADNADVLGNYFGVKPDGSTQAANGKDIEITDMAAFEATGNEVGTAIPTPSLGAPCDAGCNVISGATFAGIDLQGEDNGNEGPATGPTTIRGNYIGINAAGTADLANASYGIWSAEAKAVTIGGEENGEGNYFAGSGAGIYHEDGAEFAAIGNVFGRSPSTSLTPPAKGVIVFCFDLGTASADPVTVDGNVFELEGGIGIESVFGNADITDSFIEGAGTGIYTRGDPSGIGNLIADNVIGESTVNGILIENDFNLVLHNAIYGSLAAGIRIQDPTGAPILSSTDNQIGGSSAAEENTIREGGGDAIEIVDAFVSGGEESQNAVGRNKGDENAGLFIDLVENANEGILPPTFATLQQSSAAGSGVAPFATVRVFRKAEAIPGEIASTLAETTADAGGNWKATYPTIPTGTLVAATQTSAEGATSELAIKAASADPSSDGGGGGGGNGGSGDQPPPKDEKAPQTKIKKGPKGKIEATTVKFKFSSSEKGSTFQCKLDGKRVKKCKSPKKYKGLKPGKHVFKVWATDVAGNKDKSPAKRKFEIVAAT